MPRQNSPEQAKEKRMAGAVADLKIAAKGYKPQLIEKMFTPQIENLEIIAAPLTEHEEEIERTQHLLSSERMVPITPAISEGQHITVPEKELAESCLNSHLDQERSILEKTFGNKGKEVDFIMNLLSERRRINEQNTELLSELLVFTGVDRKEHLKDLSGNPDHLLAVIKLIKDFRKLTMQKQPQATRDMLTEERQGQKISERIIDYAKDVMELAEKMATGFINKYAVRVSKQTGKKMGQAGSIPLFFQTGTDESNRQIIEQAELVKGLMRLNVDFGGIIDSNEKNIHATLDAIDEQAEPAQMDEAANSR